MKYIFFWCLAVLTYSTTLASHTSFKRFNYQYPDGPLSSANVTLTGQVYCNATKHPLASLIVVEAEGTDPIHLSASADGKFTTLLPIAQSIKILAKAEGYESSELIYSVSANNADTTLFIEIYLTPQFELTLEGNILDAKTNMPLA